MSARSATGCGGGAATVTVTAIVTAMPEELAAVRARATDVRRLEQKARGGSGALEMVTARLCDQPVVLAVTGDGERNAREGIAALLAAAPVGRVIAAGVAGALSGDLGPSALVVSEQVMRATVETGWRISGDTANRDGRGGAGAAARGGFETGPWSADLTLVAAGARLAGARRGLIITADHIVDTIAEKEHLMRVAAQGSGAAVVDLESAAYAAAAARAGVPWVVLRAVSDTAQEALPPLLNRCRDAGGSVRRGKVAFELLGDPRALRTLLSLRQRVKLCADRLADALQGMLMDEVRLVTAAAPGASDSAGVV